MTVENWDRIAEEFQDSPPLDAWRGYMKEIYSRLTKRWLHTAPPGRCLKTDLFEEAICLQHPMTDLPEGSLGMDGSISVVASAKSNLSRHGRFHLLVSDLRQSPIRPRALTSILSGSSLDHFETEKELTVGLAEVTTGLAPGGVLVLTLDNPHNPLVWIRNHLPYRWLYRLGVVPYFVGRTWSRSQARKRLEDLGLEVTSETAVAHVPRAPAIWIDYLTRSWRSARFERRLIQGYLAFEALESLPTRYLTGYYVAIRAVQPTARQT